MINVSETLQHWGLDIEEHPLPVPFREHDDEIKLLLRRLKPRKRPGVRQLPVDTPHAGPVLLVHGGNSSGDCFLFPEGGLARYLFERGYDVWLLEWRTSPLVLRPLVYNQQPLGGSVQSERAGINLDWAAKIDLPQALDFVANRLHAKEAIGLVGHCVGGALVSTAIERQTIRQSIGPVVLSTMGLFFRVPWNGWIKANDFLIERALGDPKCRAIDPNQPALWPDVMAKAFDRWPRTWLPGGDKPEHKFLQRLSFMFGQPYSIERLHPSLRGPQVSQFFGPMHLGMYLHVSQAVRRGMIAPIELGSGSAASGGSPRPKDGPFADKTVTLVAAADSQLWHRDSIDVMYEWLRRIPQSAGRFTKVVVPRYNLQELLWAEGATTDVFPHIERALRRPAAQVSAPPEARYGT